jgi:Skp family chaperone for outer membrane proteins
MAKLSKLAARRKAIRDKKAAMTPDRRRKKAENQRKRRKAIKEGKNIKGKDYDHKTKRFTSIKNNRGNRGKGTKKEK